MILKVQLPTVTSEQQDLVLVYNRDRSFRAMLPVDDRLREQLGGELKTFWYGYVKGTVLRLRRRAPWQEW